MTITAVPDLKEEPDGFGGKIRIGLLGVQHNAQGGVRFEPMGPSRLWKRASSALGSSSTTTFRYLGKLVTGRESADQLGGPIAMAKAAGDAASIGFFQFISVIAFLSVSIGLINLFPIPMLDGGHLVYYAIEAVRGRPMGPMAQEWGFPHRVLAGHHADAGGDLERCCAAIFNGFRGLSARDHFQLQSKPKQIKRHTAKGTHPGTAGLAED